MKTTNQALPYFSIWGGITAAVYSVGLMLVAFISFIVGADGSGVLGAWAFVASGLEMIVIVFVVLVGSLGTLLAFVGTGLGVRWAINRFDHIATDILRRNTTILIIAIGLVIGITGIIPLPIVIVLAVVNWRWWSARMTRKQKLDWEPDDGES